MLQSLQDQKTTIRNFQKFLEQKQLKSTGLHAKKSHQKTKLFLSQLASVQHVKNIDMMLMCDECEMWRLLYAKRKLKKQERIEVEQGLNGLSFSCAAQLQDSDLPHYLKNIVLVQKLACEDPVEKLYSNYSAKFEDIWVYCSGPVDPWSDAEPFYPQCKACEGKDKIPDTKESGKQD